MSLAEARDAVEDAGLVLVEGDPVTDGTCESGAVIQNPEAGAEVTVGSEVTYRVCEPPESPETDAPETDPPESNSPDATPSGSASPNPTAS